MFYSCNLVSKPLFKSYTKFYSACYQLASLSTCKGESTRCRYSSVSSSVGVPPSATMLRTYWRPKWNTTSTCGDEYEDINSISYSDGVLLAISTRFCYCSNLTKLFEWVTPWVRMAEGLVAWGKYYSRWKRMFVSDDNQITPRGAWSARCCSWSSTDGSPGATSRSDSDSVAPSLESELSSTYYAGCHMCVFLVEIS